MVLAEDVATTGYRDYPPIPLSANARWFLGDRYLAKDADGTIIETPEQRFWAVAWTIAAAEGAHREEYARKFYDRLLRPLVFLPNTPTLANAGRNGCYSGCFVVPIEGDSMKAINKAREHLTEILKSGGGVGINFSPLRPAGDPIQTTHKGACGPVKVQLDYDMASTTYTQGNGALREGAQMHMLHISHPNIRKFIHVKDGLSALGHANISVLVPDAFMEALAGRSTFMGDAMLAAAWRELESGPPIQYAWPLQFGGKVYEWVDARELWDEMLVSAHKTGDPGVWFIDRANGENNPCRHLFAIECTNPCGEQALEPYGSCNLGSINIAKFWDPISQSYDHDGLRDAVYLAVRFLDDVVEVNPMPTPETEKANKLTRRIGIGPMGAADLLVAAKLPYDSPEAAKLIDEVMTEFRDAADSQSENLGVLKGVYGGWEGSDHQAQGKMYRNAWRTNVAPTGSIAVIADCSHGMEPLFSLDYTRRTETGEKMEVKHPEYARWIEQGGDPDFPPTYLRCAKDISPTDHVRMTALFQSKVDNSVSKTINLTNTATVEDVREVYRLAYEWGCKGVTIYRQGTRAVEPITDNRAKVAVAAVPGPQRERLPTTRLSTTIKFEVGEQEGYLIIGFYPDGRTGEVFIQASKQGSTVNGLLGVLGQAVSVALQYGVPVEAICDKLIHQQFEPAGRTNDQGIPFATSIPDFVGRRLLQEHGAQQLIVEPKVRATVGEVKTMTEVQFSGDLCPQCGRALTRSEGCVSCPHCEIYKCG